MDNSNVLEIIIRLLLAAASGALIGHERGAHRRAAGLRTHMLISIGAAATTMIGMYMTSPGYGDSTRIASGVVSGIGFLGAGIILVKGSNRVTGLTTAAAMWTTAVIGLAYGAGFYVLAVASTVIVYAILTVMIKMEAHQKKDHLFYIELEDAHKVNEVFEIIKEKYPVSHSSDVLPSKSGVSGHAGLSIYIHDNVDENGIGVIDSIRNIPGVVFIVKE